MQRRLDVPFRPFAVDRRVEGERHAIHADDHQDREDGPGQEIGQGADRGLHRRGVRLSASVLGAGVLGAGVLGDGVLGDGERMEYMYFVRDTASTLSMGISSQGPERRRRPWNMQAGH
jgi:hypothetical protein